MQQILGVIAALGLFAGTACAADGASVYEKKCKGCHSVGGVGGPMAKLGGALDDVGSKHDEAWLKAYTMDPNTKKADSKMPKLNLSDEDLNAVVAYMLTLKK